MKSNAQKVIKDAIISKLCKPNMLMALDGIPMMTCEYDIKNT